MKPDRNAVVVVIGGSEAFLRPATFVFSTPDGFAWVEPAYREPNPSRSAFHRVAGTMTMQPGSFTCEGDDGRIYMVGRAGDLEGGVGSDITQVLQWAESEITATGTTMDAERERLRTLLADELA